MPPKSRKRKQLEEAARRAREGKVPKVDDERDQEAAGEHSSDSDRSYDPAEELSIDSSLKLEQFAEEWVVTLDREDQVSLALFLCHHLKHVYGHTYTQAAEYAGMMLGKLDRTVRQWRNDFIENGEIIDSKQGKYQRTGVLWSSEELNAKAATFVRGNAAEKGQPNMTSGAFCQWVNESLLPNCSLKPGFPRKISVETARKWLHELGFAVLTPSKGMFFDGHERDDVVEYRGKFLRQLIELGFLHPVSFPDRLWLI